MWQILMDFWTSFLGSGLTDPTTLQLLTLVSCLSLCGMVIAIPWAIIKKVLK